MLQPPQFDRSEAPRDRRLHAAVTAAESADVGWAPSPEYLWAIHGERTARTIRHIGVLPGLLRVRAYLQATIPPADRAAERKLDLMFARQASFAGRVAAGEVSAETIIDRHALLQCYEKVKDVSGEHAARIVVSGQARRLQLAVNEGWRIRMTSGSSAAPHSVSGYVYEGMAGDQQAGVYNEYADVPGVPHETWDSSPEAVAAFNTRYDYYAAGATTEAQTAGMLISWADGGRPIIV